MVTALSHVDMLITLNEDNQIGHKEVRFLQQNVKQNLSHKGETPLSNEAQWKKKNDVCK